MKRFVTSWMVCCLLATGVTTVTATVHYVRQGAGGNGSSWANAFSDLPRSLVRGDTYYVADGSYASHTFADGQGSVITVKKATITDHGTNTGWQNSYGDGQAKFGASFNFMHGNYVIDGAIGGGPGSWETGFGFYMYAEGKGIECRTSGVSNVTIKHMEIAGHGDDGSNGSNDLIYIVSTAQKWVFSHLYLHDPGRTQFLWRSVHYSTIEYSCMARNESVSAQHSEGISAYNTNNNTIRYNVWKDIEGTGVIVVGGINWQIYGNIIYQTGNAKYSGTSNGSICGWSCKTNKNMTVKDSKVHNNTIVDCRGLSNRISFPCSGGGNLVYNNLWYQNAKSGPGSGVTASNNLILNNSAYFVNYSQDDFRLAKPTLVLGKALPAPYNKDAYGLTRGTDGAWDLGAFEYNKTNIEYRTPNTEHRMPGHPTLINDLRIYDIVGKEGLPQQMDRTGIYLVVDDAAIYKVTRIK